MTRNHHETASVAFPQIESSMRKAQAKKRPNIFENMAELVQMLQTPAANSYLAKFRGAVYIGNQIALLFMTKKAKESLRNITHIFFDGTFFTGLAQANQLFNILGLIGIGETERAISLLHVLMTHRTEHLYKEVPNKV